MVARRGLEGPPLLTVRSLATLEPWAAPLRALGRWPTVEEIDRVVSKDAGVRFLRAAPKPRAGRTRPEPTAQYDERIVRDGIVPTREENLHDLMNALVWAAFPRSKRALHARQLDLVTNAADPGRRSAEHDTIAMLDEGGVLLTSAGSIVFGHALYQHLAEKRGAVYGLGVPISPESSAHDVGSADRALAGMLSESERFTSHRCFARVRVE